MKAKFTILILGLLLACKNGKKQTAAPELGSEVVPEVEAQEKVFEVKHVGDTLDVYNDVVVHYNKSMNNISGRNTSKDGYNIGLKWQCVEFVKRYYYEHLNHKMPNSYGHAKDFFNARVADGVVNKDRNLLQYKNGSKSIPEVDDLLIFDGNLLNPYGHVAIVSKVGADGLEVVQQNVGRKSREHFDLSFKDGVWTLKDSSILGWLRKE